MNTQTEDKLVQTNTYELGYEALNKAKQLATKKQYKKSLTKIKTAIDYFRNCLSKKAHCKESRKGLMMCWDFYSSNVEFNEKESQIDVQLKRQKSIPKIPSLRVAIIDKFVENDWVKQVKGKYGGPKPANLSWKQFYDLLDKTLDELPSLDDKVAWSIKEGHINLLESFITKENDIDFNKISESEDINLLSYSIMKNDINMVLCLIENGINVNYLDENKFSPLHVAVHIGSYDISKLLIDNGAKINQKDNQGTTPLILASKKTQTDIIKLLIESGADINKLDQQSYSALSYAFFNNDLSVAEYLIEHKANLNLKDHFERSLLHWASAVGRVGISKLLLENNVDINQKDALGRTALHYASQNNHINCIKLLFKYQANSLIKDNYDDTPLIVAAFFGNKEATSCLYESSGMI